MKNILLILSLLLSFSSLWATEINKFTYQFVLLKDGKPVVGSDMDFKIEIRANSTDGNVEYSESLKGSSNGDGLVTLNIGAKAGLESVDWSSSKKYLKVIQGSKSVSSVLLSSHPYASISQSAAIAAVADHKDVENAPAWKDSIDGSFSTYYTKEELDTQVFIQKYSDLDGTPDFSLYFTEEKDSIFLKSAVGKITQYDTSNWNAKISLKDYNRLANKPITITPEQIAVLDSINVTTGVNVSELKDMINANSAKIHFPGFGNEPGKAKPIYWSQYGDTLLTNDIVRVNGVVSMTTNPSNFNVNGTLLLRGEVEHKVPGTLFFSEEDEGFLCYINEKGKKQYFGAKPSQNDIVFLSQLDVIIQGHLFVGVPPEGFTLPSDNTMTLRSSTPRIKFWDTSNSASFPGADWLLAANEKDSTGEQSFSVQDIDGGKAVFKVMAGAGDNSLLIDSNSNVGLGVAKPTEALEVDGTVVADTLYGDASQLTNLDGLDLSNVSASVINANNTTIRSDSDKDGKGDIVLKVANSEQMRIHNNGNISVNTTENSAKLNVGGKLKSTGLIVDKTLKVPMVQRIVTDTLTYVQTNDCPMNPEKCIELDKSVSVWFVPGGGTHHLFEYKSDIGTIVTFVNTGETDFEIKYSAFSPIGINVSKNESKSLKFNGNQWNPI